MFAGGRKEKKIMADIVRAPWTPEQIEKLHARQEDETKHPYTCGNCGGSLEPFKSGWYCAEQCGYHQDWCHMADAT
jgi:hypothetical protein